ncbi:MAG: hypothetical protein ACM3Q2_10345, partial [Syntrophothermus sp.]
MNTDNGALEFESYFNNEKLKSTAAAAERIVTDFTNTAVVSGEKIDDTFKITAENIKIQKDVIAGLEGQLNNLNIEISKLSPGNAQKQLKQEAAQVAAELKAEKDALKILEQQVESTEQAHTSYRTQLRLLRDEMIRMEEAGQRDSKAYSDLQRRAGELKDAIGDAQQQMAVMADDERVFKGVASTISGVTGAFTAAQGAAGLFAGENENLQKIMLKVQSLMAVTIGLQQVGEMLNKDSYFSVVILSKAKEMLAVSEMKVATAMGVSTVAARVLMATLTLGLSVAITAIVVLISRLQSKAAEARKEMEDLNKSVADSAIKPLMALEQLSAQWKALGDDIKAKEKFIESNADKFDDLGVAIKGVNDAESLFVTNKDKFIEAIMFRAKALATAEVASAKYKEAVLKGLELDKTPKTVTRLTMDEGTGTSYQVENSDYKELEEERKKLEGEFEALMKQSLEFSEEEKKILKGIGVSSNSIIEGSIAAMEESISRLKDKYKSAGSDAERAKLEKQIKAQEKILERMDKLGQKDKSKELLDKANKEAIEGFEKSLRDELDMADSVLDMLAIIEQKRKDIKGNRDVVKGETEALDKAGKEVQKKTKEETDKLLEDYSTFLDNKIRLQKQYNEDMLLLQLKLSQAKTPEEQSAITGAMTNRTEQFKKDNRGSGDKEYDTLIQEYKNFEQKKQAIIDEYEEKRKKARQFGNEALVAELNKAQGEELSDLSLAKLQDSPAFKDLFGNLDKLTVSKMIELRDKLESEWSKLNLSPEALQALRDKINETTSEIQKRNPFLALSEALKKYKKDGSKANFKDLMEGVAGSIDLVKGSFDAVVGSLDKLGIKADEGTQQVLSDISGMMQGASDLATGIATGNPLQIIQGSITLISNGIDLIAGGKDRKLERSIQRHAKEVENLKQKYEDLERAVDKALGSDRYQAQKATIDNLKKQQREYAAMMQEERDKKKTDDGKVKEYEQARKDAAIQIEDTINQVREDILGSSVSSIASDLGTAIIDAFSAGENAA